VPTFEINGLFESHKIAIDQHCVGLDGTLLPTDRSGELIHGVRHPGLARWLKMDAEKTCVFWLDRNTEQ
jgi:hypothetical protein